MCIEDKAQRSQGATHPLYGIHPGIAARLFQLGEGGLRKPGALCQFVLGELPRLTLSAEHFAERGTDRRLETQRDGGALRAGLPPPSWNNARHPNSSELLLLLGLHGRTNVRLVCQQSVPHKSF
ncbi:MAG: hypothetical protein NTY53_24260, partial [Kiritimatiellaeota bacterium]|nr:hypothetical protein [Kiritimatiellota bacterium]